MWNLIGIAAWVLLLAYTVFVVINIRRRHLRMLVVDKKTRSWQTIVIDVLEGVVLLGAFAGMVWVTWLRPVDYTDTKTVTLRYKYDPLIVQPDGNRSYYVISQGSKGKDAPATYTYWTAGARIAIDSRSAELSMGPEPMTVKASAYPWNLEKLKTLDRTNGQAWVASMTGTYKNTFLNGLGMRAGKVAQRFDLIRLPNETMVKILPLADPSK